MKNPKTGDVWMFMGWTDNFLVERELLYNKQFVDNQMGALHTYAITITNRSIGQFSARGYSLAWYPFLGFRWLQLGDVSVGAKIVTLWPITAYTKVCCDRNYNDIRLDLKCEVLEVKQNHFDKWRGEEMTRRLIDHLSQPHMTQYVQEEITRIYEGVKNGTLKPKDTGVEHPQRVLLT
jgi:hypothetical protein